MNKVFTFLFSLLTFTCIAADSDYARLNDPAFLKGYWPLSKDALDYSGKGNHGTWSGTEAYQQGPFGKDNASFNLSSYINAGNSTTLNPTNEITISVWVKYTFALGTNRHILSKYNSSLVHGFTTMISATGGPKIEIWNLGSNKGYISNFVLSNNTYYHLCFVYNGSSALIYVNGKSVGSGGSSGSIGYVTNSVNIGAINGGNNFGGNISAARLYNIALSSSEISALYRMEQSVPKYSPSPIADPTCQLWLWNGQDLAQGRAITNYKVATGNGVMKFDGAASGGSYLSTPDFIGTNDFTVTLWCRANSLGGGSSGRLFDNGRTYAFVFGTTKYYISNDSGATQVHSGDTGYTFPQWNCLTITRSSGIVNFYRNGRSVGALNQNAGTLYSATTLTIGNVSTYNRTFDGYLGHVIIWSRVLSAAEIKDVYDSLKIYY